MLKKVWRFCSVKRRFYSYI